ncbi:hypothetical protein E2C01_003105 [Portunus trituberculatus]|uniref:Uncharacterized protein n=1 Tax=Portunus trituberculatus TaxID=210409 RepID=A0A5B7CN38_PORTR|nr:hypothetical protein [Portunus trituberculatus]
MVVDLVPRGGTWNSRVKERVMSMVKHGVWYVRLHGVQVLACGSLAKGNKVRKTTPIQSANP